MPSHSVRLAFLVSLLASTLLGQSYTFTTFAGTGGAGSVDATGTAARFNSPRSVATDAAGNVYVGEFYNGTIRKITPAGVVTTIAGKSEAGGFDNGLRGYAHLDGPFGIVLDTAGNIYAADGNADAIRKITTAGVVLTFAGELGIYGTSDGVGNAAHFGDLSGGVALDNSGNLYVADYGNHTIRKITSSRVVTTLAGTAGSSGSTDATGAAARFNLPTGIAVDNSGNVFVCDTNNNTIRKITPVGIVTTFAGTAGTFGSTNGTGTAARFDHPMGLTIDSSGNLYVADQYNQQIRKITPAQVVTTIAGSGLPGYLDATGTSAKFNYPVAIANDATGNLYVVDNGNQSIRKIAAGTLAVTTLAGQPSIGSADGTGSVARFYNPWGIATDGAGNVIVADTQNETIRRITSAATATTIAGTAGQYGTTDGIGASARFASPYGVAADAAGNAFVADTVNDTIRKFTASTGAVSTIAGSAGAAGFVNNIGSAARFDTPKGIDVDASGNLYVADSGNHAIRKIDTAGNVTTLAGSTTSGSTDGTGSAAHFNIPSGVAVDSGGNIFVADSGNATIRKVTSAGVVTTFAGTAGTAANVDGTGAAARFYQPWGLTFDNAGNLLVADIRNNNIRKITTVAVVTTIGGSGFPSSTDGTGSFARFNGPAGVAVDTSGNVYVAETFNNTIRIGKPAIADAATIDSPTGLVNAPRTLNTSPQTATSWQWAIIRKPDGSSAALSSTTIRNPVFVPDVADVYTFRLTASNGVNSSITTVDLSATLPARGDMNRDGKADIVWRNSSTGGNYLWTMDGATLTSSSPLPTVADTNWKIVAAGDFDGDGKTDLFWRREGTGENYLWQMNGSTLVAATPVMNVADPAWKIVAAGDFNNDGKCDLFWRRDGTGETYVWLMNGANILASAAGPTIADLNWITVGTGDFDGDQKSDLVWRHATSGQNYIWFMNGTSVASSAALTAVPDIAWKIVAVGDMDGDGIADLFWRRDGTGENYIWILSGNLISFSAPAPSVPDAGWKVVGAGAFYGDSGFYASGLANLLWRHDTTGENYIWFMNRTFGHAEPTTAVPDTNWVVVSPR